MREETPGSAAVRRSLENEAHFRASLLARLTPTREGRRIKIRGKVYYAQEKY